MPIFTPLRRSVLLTLTMLSACGAAQVSNSAVGSADGRPGVAITGAPGDFLAGRLAASEGHMKQASEFFLQGLAKDPTSPDLEFQAFMTSMLAGRPEAVTLARKLPGNLPAQLLLANADAKAGNWTAAEGHFTGLVRQGMVQVLQPLMVAWTQQGAGDTDAALATLKPLLDGQRFRGGYAVHAALIADLAGRTEEAAKYYKIAQTESGGLNLQLARMLASWEVRQNHLPEAQKIFTQLENSSGDLAVALPQLYANAAKRPVNSATDGMAEAYLAIAGALRGQENDEVALIMLHLALDLRPDLTVARMLTADIQDSSRHVQAALDILKPVEDSDPLISVVRLREANLEQKLGDTPAALKLLDQVAATAPDRPEPWAIRGDILNGQKKFTEAVAAYSTAIDKSRKSDRNIWPLYYARGIALERSNNWPKAEADLLHALELSPDQPDVLNYLGYSWTEQNKNLPKARQMIQKAVDQRPNDGAILDSLGWVTFRQGSVPAALKLLQRATELDPSDATVNLHLGDAYWAAGRKLEAQFQWRRALTLDPEPEDAAKLQSKLHDSEVALGNLPTPAAAAAAKP
jgi:tetratricopeptide (TPR) repeat protein